MCSRSCLDLLFGFRIRLIICHQQPSLIDKLSLTLLGSNDFSFAAILPSTAPARAAQAFAPLLFGLLLDAVGVSALFERGRA